MKIINKIFFTLLVLGYAQVVSAQNEALLTLSSGSAIKGGSVQLNLNINTSEVLTNITGVQWDFNFNPSDITSVSVSDGSAATSAGKTTSCSAVSSGVYRCIVSGFNENTISNGVLSVATFTLANNTSSTQIPVQFSGLFATNSNADSVGILATAGNINITSASDTIAPSVPSGLSAIAVSVSQINLSWNASTDAVGVVGYRIFRNNNQIDASITNSYSNTGLTPSTSYTYSVTAYDAAGNNSLQSLPISVTTQSNSVVVPPPPSSGGGGGGGGGGAPITNPVTPITTTQQVITPSTTLTTTPSTTSTQTSTQTGLTGLSDVKSTTQPLTKSLFIGMRDSEVTTLQKFLVQNGYLQTTSFGYFGVNTLASVKRYQCNNNIVCSGNESTTGYGIVGSKTRASINSKIGYGVIETEEQKIKRLTGLIAELLKTVSLLQAQLNSIKR